MFACAVCHKTFTKASNLDRHNRRTTSCAPIVVDPQGPEPMGVGEGLGGTPKCKYCNRSFATGSAMRRHERLNCKTAPGAALQRTNTYRHGHHYRSSKGGSICEHGRRRTRCKECGGASICEHGRDRYQCRECGGARMCEHGLQRLHCMACSQCEHGQARA